MGKRKPYAFDPDWGIAPGVTLSECLEHSKITKAALARKLGVTRQYIGKVIHGDAKITARLALKLEQAGIGPHADFWLSLETHYRLALARGKKDVTPRG